MFCDEDSCKLFRRETTSRIEELSARFDELQDAVELLVASLTGNSVEPVERIDVSDTEAE